MVDGRPCHPENHTGYQNNEYGGDSRNQRAVPPCELLQLITRVGRPPARLEFELFVPNTQRDINLECLARGSVR
jgi:hypothetical protein